MSSRAHIPIKVRYAAALLQICEPGTTVELIPYDHAKLMSADQIISLFHADHYPEPKADGGPDEPWNLMHRLIAAHREKTAKIDVPTIAKGKRLRRNRAEHQAVMAGEPIIRPRRKAKIAARVNPWPKGRKIESRRKQQR